MARHCPLSQSQSTLNVFTPGLMLANITSGPALGLQENPGKPMVASFCRNYSAMYFKRELEVHPAVGEGMKVLVGAFFGKT